MFPFLEPDFYHDPSALMPPAPALPPSPPPLTAADIREVSDLSSIPPNFGDVDVTRLISAMAEDDEIRIPVDANDIEVLRAVQRSLGVGRLRCLWSPVPSTRGARADYSKVSHVRILASNYEDAAYALWELNRHRRLGARLHLEVAPYVEKGA